MRQNENLDFSDVIMSHMSVLKINVGGNRILTIRGYERTQGTRPKTVKIEMWLLVENNNKYVRGKKKVRETGDEY